MIAIYIYIYICNTGIKLGGNLGEIVALGPKAHPKWDPGRSGSLAKKKYFFRETHFNSVTLQTQAVVTIYRQYIMFLLPLNGNSMCNG